MKVIFLDIDGVLINRKYANRNVADPNCVEFLNRITDRTGAKIVVSSSWKHHGLQKITLILKQWRVDGDIIDITPDINGPRWLEIGEWLAIARREKDIESIVIIDDEDDACPDAIYCVKPGFEYGLTITDMDRAIAILEGYEP